METLSEEEKKEFRRYFHCHKKVISSQGNGNQELQCISWHSRVENQRDNRGGLSVTSRDKVSGMWKR